MAYIWINPVTAGMYEEEALEAFLRNHGFRRIYPSIDWIRVVKEKYRETAERSRKPVIDIRCPKINELLDKTELGDSVTIPDIFPILIHCGKELSEREEYREEEKIITTPCQALADLGNSLSLRRTRFLTWNRFLEERKEELTGKNPGSSPIPPGFFEDLGLKMKSVTGEEQIKRVFEEGIPEDVQILELLYCKDGCHNGDGIRKCER